MNESVGILEGNFRDIVHVVIIVIFIIPRESGGALRLRRCEMAIAPLPNVLIKEPKKRKKLAPF